jgi:cysteine synthase A
MSSTSPDQNTSFTQQIVQFRVVDSALDLIGNTPLVRLARLAPAGHATVYGKLESANPGGSIKDRIAKAMIEDAEQRGLLRPGGVIVEPTSGNTGIGLALVAALKGYHLILVMPEDMSLERRTLIDLLGAEVLLTPALGAMGGAVTKAQELASTNGYFMPQQFENQANPETHRLGTGREIVEALGPDIDAFVVGVGTGGTLTGVARAIRAVNPDVKVVAVEPSRSAVLSGRAPGWHRIQGIGAGFVPVVLDMGLVDQVVTVSDEKAFSTMRDLARKEGLIAGPSSGAAVWAAIEIAQRLGPSKTVVVILPDTGERYLSLLASGR